MGAALVCSLLFWAVIVQYALSQSKQSTIELSSLKKEEGMTDIEKLLYMSKLKDHQKKKMMKMS